MFLQHNQLTYYVGIAHLPTKIDVRSKYYPYSKEDYMAQDFRVVKDAVRPDSRGRLTLGQVIKAKSYRVMLNEAGQILLDPVVTIPERELWLWQNPDALASVERGIEQTSTEETHDLGSFAQYADLEFDN